MEGLADAVWVIMGELLLIILIFIFGLIFIFDSIAKKRINKILLIIEIVLLGILYIPQFIYMLK